MKIIKIPLSWHLTGQYFLFLPMSSEGSVPRFQCKEFLRSSRMNSAMQIETSNLFLDLRPHIARMLRVSVESAFLSPWETLLEVCMEKGFFDSLLMSDCVYTKWTHEIQLLRYVVELALTTQKFNSLSCTRGSPEMFPLTVRREGN